MVWPHDQIKGRRPGRVSSLPDFWGVVIKLGLQFSPPPTAPHAAKLLQRAAARKNLNPIPNPPIPHNLFQNNPEGPVLLPKPHSSAMAVGQACANHPVLRYCLSLGLKPATTTNPTACTPPSICRVLPSVPLADYDEKLPAEPSVGVLGATPGPAGPPTPRLAAVGKGGQREAGVCAVMGQATNSPPSGPKWNKGQVAALYKTDLLFFSFFFFKGMKAFWK